MLTPREVEVTRWWPTAMSNAAIARRFTLSERSIENHVSRILIKARPDHAHRTDGESALAAATRLSIRRAVSPPSRRLRSSVEVR